MAHDFMDGSGIYLTGLRAVRLVSIACVWSFFMECYGAGTRPHAGRTPRRFCGGVGFFNCPQRLAFARAVAMAYRF